MKYKLTIVTGLSSCESEIDFDGDISDLVKSIFKDDIYIILSNSPIKDPHLLIQTKNIESVAVLEIKD